MAKMKPNAGPWSYECTLGSVTIKDADGLAVAQARPRKDGWNAELLAAAPAMLAALQEVDGYLTPYDGEDDVYHEIRCVIGKAIAEAQGVRP